jgi:uncharacterized protein (DUF2252 family)
MPVSGKCKAQKMQTISASASERCAYGKSLRRDCPRVEQANWKPPRLRADPVELMVAAMKGRVATLIPIKLERMAASPFGFFRGAAPVMAADLASTEACGLEAQLCGDAHVRNLGMFTAPDGRLIFDLNDFDETVRGPFEWDVKRLATSIVLAGREASDSDRQCCEAVMTFIRSYRDGMHEFSRMAVIELARYRVHRHQQFAPLQSVLRKAERATPQCNLEKLTIKKGQKRTFRNDPPLLRRVDDEVAQRVIASLKSYRDTLGVERQHFLDQYRPVDVAFKVVGTGSVGTRDYVVLLFGSGENDPLFLQIKEEPASSYARYLSAERTAEHQGRRVVEGQRRMQAQSDILLGWTSIAGRHYLVRQLADHKASIGIDELKGEALLQYAQVCGEVLAKGHARSGDPCALAGYMGSGSKFDKAIAAFASVYADQTTADHKLLLAAIRSGRVGLRTLSRKSH